MPEISLRIAPTAAFLAAMQLMASVDFVAARAMGTISIRLLWALCRRWSGCSNYSRSSPRLIEYGPIRTLS